MTKCIMRELELAASKNKTNLDLKMTLKAAKLIHKQPCLHPGGCIAPDECINTFINKKNEEKVFVGTNDEDLRNELRNLGTVPLFFFKRQVLVMDAPGEQFAQKMKLKEVLKMEPSIKEKKFLKGQKELIERIKHEQEIADKIKYRKSVKDLYCMGIKTKFAKGPNPMSIRKKAILKSKDNPGTIKKGKRRPRKGKRSRELSLVQK